MPVTSARIWAWHGGLVGIWWGHGGCLVGPSLIVSIFWLQLLGNVEGFLRDDHGAFPTPEGPLQKVPLSHPMNIIVADYIVISPFAVDQNPPTNEQDHPLRKVWRVAMNKLYL